MMQFKVKIQMNFVLVVVDHVYHFQTFLIWVIYNWQHWKQANTLGIIRTQ